MASADASRDGIRTWPLRLKWHHVYFLLAVLDIAAVCTGLYLNQRITGLYTESVRVNREWAERSARFAELSLLAGEVNAPANDVFESHAVEREEQRLRTARERFQMALANERAALIADSRGDEFAALIQDSDDCAAVMDGMTDEAARIFALLRSGDDAKAGEHMAVMDRRFADFNRAFARIGEHIRAIQQDRFLVQTEMALSLARYQYLIVGLIVMMIVAVGSYGYWMTKRVRQSEAEIRLLAALEASETRKAAVIDAALDCIVTMDHQGRITEFNPAAERAFGYKRGFVVGRDLAETLIPTRFREGHRQGLARHLAGGEGRMVGKRIEVEAMHATGREFPVELAIVPVRLKGEVLMFTAHLRDISERKQAEQEVARARLELERKNLDLSKARDRALKAARAKAQFLANMSHEIRTPLNAIMGIAELLLDGEVNGEQRECLELVHSSGNHLLGVINNILDFSKLETGKVEIELSDLEPRKLVEEVIGLLAELARPKDIELFAVIDPEVPQVVGGDAGRLRQVLTNLINNAIKFTERGEVVVRVGLTSDSVVVEPEDVHVAPDASQADDSDAVMLRFSIRDTGIGIPEEARPKLFQSFSQVDPTYNRKYEGTGLGLAISKQLTEMMGGVIDVDSEPGKGSTFWFTARLARRPAGSGAAVQQVLAGWRLLYRDDHPLSRTITVGQLRALGAKVEEVDNLDQVFFLLNAAVDGPEPYTAAVFNHRPPDNDGIMAARLIRAEMRLRRHPVILLGVRQPVDRDEIPPNVAAFLVKPLRLAALGESLCTALGRPAPAATDTVVKK